jgi:hypothetical protein
MQCFCKIVRTNQTFSNNKIDSLIVATIWPVVNVFFCALGHNFRKQEKKNGSLIMNDILRHSRKMDDRTRRTTYY